MTGDYTPYWGKARIEGLQHHWHPLAWHGLDVAAVGAAWWAASTAIRRRMGHGMQERVSQAWLLFFLALHDLGKFDARFQAKVEALYRDHFPSARVPCPRDIQSYRHGPAGFAWFVAEKSTILGRGLSLSGRNAWHAWLAAVTGHHGHIPAHGDDELTGSRSLPAQDAAARHAWFMALEALFLRPAGLTLADDPPELDEGQRAFLAGFCSVCDWLGSDDTPGQFEFTTEAISPEAYFTDRLRLARRSLARAGLWQAPLPSSRFATLYPSIMPRQVQTLVDSLPLEPGLTLIEAPTGSGKTEAALALAGRLLASGHAESIIFALPTQATANAMLARLEAVADTLYPGGANLILAHGKARYNPRFDTLKARAALPGAQGVESATVHCAEWLAASRKRAFLGQIGVCTVDQVLLAVLPVRHAFIRSFGLGKSVLVVDEVHAYDSHMQALLTEVLSRQRQAGGSALLLSATLPSGQRNKLLAAWSDQASHLNAPEDYPLITRIGQAGPVCYHYLEKKHLPPPRKVSTERYITADMLPDAELIQRMLNAARHGAKVGVVCNLVADAQKLARALRRHAADIPVDIFHSRYRFPDRQEKESIVIGHYGPERAAGGRILVATQVVEQSLDLDFDWLITQLCPMDLLFQRLGRLHRHHRDWRPSGFETPVATLLVPPDGRYGAAQEAVYCKAMLWRTETLLQRRADIEFPQAYRPSIEAVYDETPWPDEPESITLAMDKYLGEAMALRLEALRLARTQPNPFNDDDEKIRAFTRAGEQGPLVLLTTADGLAPVFRPDARLASLPDWERREVLDLEHIGVPNSWRGLFPKTEDGQVHLAMREAAPGLFMAETAKAQFAYDRDVGLRRVDRSGEVTD